MTVGACTMKLYLNDKPLNLKAKRSIVRTLKERITHKFNVSVEEVGERDKWQVTELGIAVVTRTKEEAHRVLNRIIQLVENDRRFSIIDIQIEMLI